MFVVMVLLTGLYRITVYIYYNKIIFTSGRYDTEVINSARIFSCFFFVVFFLCFFPFCVEPRA